MGTSWKVYIALLLLASLGLSVLGCRTNESGNTTTPKESHAAPVPAQDVARGSVLWKNLAVMKALGTYKDLARIELVSDSRVKSVQRGIDLSLSDVSTAEAATAIEKALLEQAGVVITRLDDQRVSVTYNDALPISKP